MVVSKFSSRLSNFYVPFTAFSYLFAPYADQNCSRNYSDSSHIQIRTSEICSNISVLRKRIEYERYRIHLLEAKCRIRAREHRRRLTYDPPEFIDENNGPHRPSNENDGDDSRTPLPLPLLLGYDDTLSTDAVLTDHAADPKKLNIYY